MTHYIIIFVIMAFVALTVITSMKALEVKDGRALTMGLSCALFVGITLLLFDMSLTGMVAILS